MTGAFSIMFLVLAVVLRLHDIGFKKVTLRLFNLFSLTFIIIGPLFLLIFIYWYNYQRISSVIASPGNIIEHTRWVKSDIPVYFVNDSTLFSLALDGGDRQVVFNADDQIREFHFSPDGNHLLVMTNQSIYLIERNTLKNRLVDSVLSFGTDGQLNDLGGRRDIKGVVSNIQWSPDSRKFCYEVARWSPYSSQSQLYIFDIGSEEKIKIQSPTRKLSLPYWDLKSENLYFIRYEAKDVSREAYPFEIKLWKIPLSTLKAEFVFQMPVKEAKAPLSSLGVRGIDLFLDYDYLNFGRAGQTQNWLSEDKATIGIDEDDHLYIVKGKWFRKRLFKIRRQEVEDELSLFKYKGGSLMINQIGWIPGGNYVLMNHRSLGLLVLDPWYGRVGQLAKIQADFFGWLRK